LVIRPDAGRGQYDRRIRLSLRHGRERQVRLQPMDKA
jgi:hypothetical protein